MLSARFPNLSVALALSPLPRLPLLSPCVLAYTVPQRERQGLPASPAAQRTVGLLGTHPH